MNYKQRYNQFIEREYPEIIQSLGYEFFIGEYLSNIELSTGKVLTDYVDVMCDVYSNNYLMNSYSLSGSTLTIDGQTITLSLDTTDYNSGENMVIVKLYITVDNYEEIVFRLGKSYND